MTNNAVDDDTKSSKTLEDKRLQMRRFDSTVSTGKIKRTFSKDLFMVDRGRLRARHDERYIFISEIIFKPFFILINPPNHGLFFRNY